MLLDEGALDHHLATLLGTKRDIKSIGQLREEE